MRESCKLSSNFNCYGASKVEAVASCVRQAHEALPQSKSCLRSLQRVFRLDTDTQKKASIKKVDAFLATNDQYTKASSGTTVYGFESALDRSFNRGYTDYFVNERHNKIGSWESPKSKGQYIGKLIQSYYGICKDYHRGC